MSHNSLFVAGVAAALFAQSAVAGCPPGYISKAGHCIPGRASAQHTPTAVAPMTAVSPVAGGKAALNPQPIPPGHSLHTAPAPAANKPTGQTPH